MDLDDLVIDERVLNRLGTPGFPKPKQLLLFGGTSYIRKKLGFDSLTSPLFSCVICFELVLTIICKNIFKEVPVNL